MSPPERPTRAAPGEKSEAGASAPGGSRPEARSRPPKPYHPPRLVCYGRLTDVTQFGGSQVVDSGGNLGNLQ